MKLGVIIYRPANRRHKSPGDDLSRYRASLPLLGSNQDSADPEGPLQPTEFQQLATTYASSCHPMLEFAGFMLDFAVFYSL